jgi:CRP/FNR family transcriptional regulator
MDAEVRHAIALSHLGDLPTDVVEHLTANAVKIKLAAGSVSSREGEIARHLDLVVTGVVRMFVVAPDGRTMTIRYGRAGALIGAVSLFAAGYASPVTTQALVDAELLRIPASVASRLGDGAGVRFAPTGAERACRPAEPAGTCGCCGDGP